MPIHPILETFEGWYIGDSVQLVPGISRKSVLAGALPGGAVYSLVTTRPGHGSYENVEGLLFELEQKRLRNK